MEVGILHCWSCSENFTLNFLIYSLILDPYNYFQVVSRIIPKMGFNFTSQQGTSPIIGKKSLN